MKHHFQFYTLIMKKKLIKRQIINVLRNEDFKYLTFEEQTELLYTEVIEKALVEKYTDVGVFALLGVIFGSVVGFIIGIALIL